MTLQAKSSYVSHWITKKAVCKFWPKDETAFKMIAIFMLVQLSRGNSKSALHVTVLLVTLLDYRSQTSSSPVLLM